MIGNGSMHGHNKQNKQQQKKTHIICQWMQDGDG